MNLQEANALADQVLREIQPFCEKCEVAGSIRRRRPEVHDIDIVLIPKPFMWSSLISKMVEKGAKPVIQGPKLARLTFNGEQIDLYVASPENWGTLLLIRTGSMRHNIRLMNRARELGLKFSAARGVIDGDRVIASKTEEDIFSALGLEYKPPEEREV